MTVPPAGKTAEQQAGTAHLLRWTSRSFSWYVMSRYNWWILHIGQVEIG